MICYVCHKETIYLEEDGMKRTHVKCSNCDDIDVIIKNDFILQLIIYNIDRTEKVREGKYACLFKGEKIEDCPYIFNSDPAKWWKEGWEEENKEFKMQSYLMSGIKRIEELKVSYKELREKAIESGEDWKGFNKTIEIFGSFFEKLRDKKYIFGSSYRKEMRKVIEELESIDKEK